MSKIDWTPRYSDGTEIELGDVIDGREVCKIKVFVSRCNRDSVLVVTADSMGCESRARSNGTIPAPDSWEKLEAEMQHCADEGMYYARWKVGEWLDRIRALRGADE